MTAPDPLAQIRARAEACADHGTPGLHAPKDRARLLAALDAVMALHKPAHAVFNWRSGLRLEDPCPDCNGKAGVHPCGCWGDEDVEYECRECIKAEGNGSRVVVLWPCPTVAAVSAALGGGE